MTVGGFTTCSGEQHSQNSFILLSFFLQCQEMLILDLSLSCTRPLLLSIRTLTVFTDCTFRYHTDTASKNMRVVCIEDWFLFFNLVKEGRVWNQSEWSTDLSLSCLYHLLQQLIKRASNDMQWVTPYRYILYFQHFTYWSWSVTPCSLFWWQLKSTCPLLEGLAAAISFWHQRVL